MDRSLIVAKVLPTAAGQVAEIFAHTSPYLPTWRSPRDAMARCFYRWDAADAVDGAHPGRRP